MISAPILRRPFQDLFQICCADLLRYPFYHFTKQFWNFSDKGQGWDHRDIWGRQDSCNYFQATPACGVLWFSDPLCLVSKVRAHHLAWQFQEGSDALSFWVVACVYPFDVSGANIRLFLLVASSHCLTKI